MINHPQKYIRISVYSLIGLVLCLGLGWLALFTLEQQPNEKIYREALDATAHNVLVSDNKNPNSALKIYAVNVFHSTPFEKTIISGGVYFRDGLIITASHVAGNWPAFQDPRVLIAGQDLSAKVFKEGSLESVDLALLSVDKSRLPISLLLRRNPICRGPLVPGTSVVVVSPTRLKPSRIISPMQIAPEFRARFGSVITAPEASGSGVFDLRRKCLLGIMSRKIEKVSYRIEHGRMVEAAAGLAGYFVPARDIKSFIPADLR